MLFNYFPSTFGLKCYTQKFITNFKYIAKNVFALKMFLIRYKIL